MKNDKSRDYYEVIDAYKNMLEQLSNGTADEHLFQYAACVYEFAQSENGMGEQMAEEIYNIVNKQENVGLVFSMLSYILQLDAKTLYLESFLSKLRGLQKISYLEWKQAAFYYIQLNRFRLQHSECDTEGIRTTLAELARRGVTSFMRQLNVAVSPLPYEKRMDDRIVVLTEEFLEDDSEHMFQVLESCYKLQHETGKKVLLINTGESVSRMGEVSFFGCQYGKWDESLQRKSQMEWNGKKIDFYQCEAFCGDMNETEKVIKKILEYNPGMVFHIGDHSFLAGVIDEWIPVMSIGGTYGRYPVSPTEFQAAFESREDLEQEFCAVVRDYGKTIQEEKNLKVRLVFPADYFEEETRKVPHYEEGEWETYTIHPGRKKIWAVELSMLREVDAICRKYDIPYFAYKGTLLGAVRYQGFFPWDDDIDLAMKREDYDKFAEIAEKELGKRYCLMDGLREPRWEEFKIKILCTSDVDAMFRGEKKSAEYLPCIDISILDYVPAETDKKQERQSILRDITDLMFQIEAGGSLEGHSALEFEKLKEKLAYKMNEKASVRNQLVQLQQLTASAGKIEGSKELYNSIVYYYRQNWDMVLPEEWFNRGEELSFENMSITAPKGYTELLTMLYGSEEWKDVFFCGAGIALHVREEEFVDLDKSLYDEEDLLAYKNNFFEEETREISFSGYRKVEYFHIEKKMKHAWAASLKVLKEVEKICQRNNLQYFADYGTLLGAIRHQGYVPWDDDIDVSMRREDYNRFLEIAKNELPQGYCIVDEVFNEDWETSVSRVINIPDLQNATVTPHTEKEEEFFGCPYIIGIDLYPLDYIPFDKEEADLQMDIFANVIKVKYDFRENNKVVNEEIRERIELLKQICNYQFKYDDSLLKQILTMIGAVSQMYGPEDGEEFAYMYARFNSKKYKFRKEWFTESIAMPFETTTVQVPKEYMKTLMITCGKYWEMGYKGGSGHDYPFYNKQDADLEKKGVILA